MMTLLLNWLIILVIGGIITYYLDSRQAFYSGIIGLVIGVTISYLVSLFIPTSNIFWSLIAVSYTGFFAGMFGSKYGYSNEKS